MPNNLTLLLESLLVEGKLEDFYLKQKEKIQISQKTSKNLPWYLIQKDLNS